MARLVQRLHDTDPFELEQHAIACHGAALIAQGSYKGGRRRDAPRLRRLPRHRWDAVRNVLVLSGLWSRKERTAPGELQVVEDVLASVAKIGAQLRLPTTSARSEGPGIEHKPMRDAPAIDVKSANVVPGTKNSTGRRDAQEVFARIRR